MAAKRDYKYHSSEKERNEAIKKSNKKSFAKRIFIGSAFSKWEENRQTCGYSPVDFAHHLLSLHEKKCRNYVGVKRLEEEKAIER